MKLSSRAYLAISAAVAICVFGLVWLYMACMPMAYLESGYPVWIVKQSHIRDCNFGDVIFVGDSRAEAAIMPTKLGPSGWNLSQGGTSPIETYYFLERVLRCPRLPRLVVYTHGIIAFDHISDGLWQTATRFGYISYAELREIGAAADKLHDPSVRNQDSKDGLGGVFRDIAYSVGFPSVSLGSLLQGGVFQRLHHNREVLHDVVETKGFMPYPKTSATVPIALEARTDAFEPRPIQAYYFDKTLRALADAGVPMIFLATPIPTESAAVLRSTVREGFATFIQQAMAAHGKGMAIGDNLLEPWPDRYFMDAQHLDPQGAEKFTALLKPCLQRWMAWATTQAPFQQCDFHETGDLAQRATARTP